VLVAASCNSAEPAHESAPPQTTATSAPADEPNDTQPPQTQPPQTEPPQAPAATDFDVDALLAKDPLIIFSAFPPRPENADIPLPRGQRDFFDLWKPGAPWQDVLERVDAYRLHAFQMRRFLDDEQLTVLIDFLREHQIPLIFETEPLLPPDPAVCEHNESFEAPYDLEQAVRLKKLGGHVDIIAVEEPYSYGHLLDTPGSCQYSVERVAQEVFQHVSNLRDLFGDIPVGSIEPIWKAPPTSPHDMEVWLDTFEQVAGEPFAFLDVDPDWSRPDWADVARGIEAAADTRGVPFGILYNGGVEPDNRAWMDFMMANAAEFEVVHGGTPQHVSFQSWVDWPDHLLPENDLSGLTSSILRYFGQRIELAVEAADDGVVARVTDLDGHPVEGVHLSVSRTTDQQSGATQTVRGVVPDGATEAVALVRANAEDAIVGTAAVTLVDISFSDGAGGPNLVPNGSFADGTNQWNIHGSAAGAVRSVAAGSRRGLSISASPGQDVFVDGAAFPVTAGTDYEFTVTYDLEGGSADSVVVSTEFIDTARINIPLHAISEDIGQFVTDAGGEARIPGDLIGAGPATLEVRTTGDLEHWPATASISVG